jgi:hypothetical protein
VNRVLGKTTRLPKREDPSVRRLRQLLPHLFPGEAPANPITELRLAISNADPETRLRVNEWIERFVGEVHYRIAVSKVQRMHMNPDQFERYMEHMKEKALRELGRTVAESAAEVRESQALNADQDEYTYSMYALRRTAQS